MTEINKEALLTEILNLLKQTTKDYFKHTHTDVIHIDMGEIASYETIFGAIYTKKEITQEAININRLFRKELDDAHKILEKNLEIAIKRMIIS